MIRPIKLTLPPEGERVIPEARPVQFCPTCRDERNEPVHCAPTRCYCHHTDCPAYSSAKQGRTA